MRFIYSPEENMDNVIANNSDEIEFKMEVRNCGFGPATNIYVIHDEKYVVNGVNAASDSNFLCSRNVLLFSKDSSIICKVRLYVSKNLIKKNREANKVTMLDFVYQDMLGNIIRKKIMYIVMSPHTRIIRCDTRVFVNG